MKKKIVKNVYKSKRFRWKSSLRYHNIRHHATILIQLNLLFNDIKNKTNKLSMKKREKNMKVLKEWERWRDRSVFVYKFAQFESMFLLNLLSGKLSLIFWMKITKKIYIYSKLLPKSDYSPLQPNILNQQITVLHRNYPTIFFSF